MFPPLENQPLYCFTALKQARKDWYSAINRQEIAPFFYKVFLCSKNRAKCAKSGRFFVFRRAAQ